MTDLFFCNGGADKEAEKLKKKIINSPNISVKEKNVYYVSSNGNDQNDGLTPDSPIKSFSRVNALPLRAGSVVLFERNSVFRESVQLFVRGGVKYSAYGSGLKPLILGSLIDYAVADLWNKNKTENIWELPLNTDEVGLISFNFDSLIGWRKFSISDLTADGEFFHDLEKNTLYLYCGRGNPGEIYENIEIATAKDLVYAQNVNHVSISNLAFKYATFSPFTLGNNKEIEMFDLEISWIGGRLFTKRENNYILYGNALEFWYRAYDISVKRCWIHQIFDAALTFQGFGDDRPEFINIDFSDNLIEYCSMNFEFWAGNQGDGIESIIENIYFAKNIIRFGGYGWGGIQRPDKGDQALILGWNRLYNQMKNFVVTDNILDCADGNIIFTKGPNEQKGLTVNNNTYYQKAHVPTHKFNEIVRGSGQCASNQAEFEREIAQFEISPKKVEWLTD